MRWQVVLRTEKPPLRGPSFSTPAASMSKKDLEEEKWHKPKTK
jgi:hypothetical protein